LGNIFHRVWDNYFPSKTAHCKVVLPLASATFADNAYISSWAIEAVGQVQGVDIMGGVGNNMFAPRGMYTREQSIITMLRLLDWLG